MGVYKHPNGNWYLRYRVRDPKTGEWRQRQHRARGSTEKEAKLHWAEVQTELAHGTHVDATSLTTGEYLRQWLTDVAKDNVRETTFRLYEGAVEQHLIPGLGNILIQSLSPAQIQAFCRRKRDAPGRTGGKLSGSRVRLLFIILHSALKKAVEWQFIYRNPCDQVKAPKAERRRMELPPPDAVRAILNDMKERDYLYFIPALIAASTGMRRGEVLGLKWADVDLDSRIARMNRALGDRRGAEDAPIVAPKSGKGRTVALPAGAIVVLREHRQWQRRMRQECQDWAGEDWICCEPNGRRMDPERVSKHWENAASRAGFPMRFHDLRHFFASTLLAGGEHLKVAQELLGHSSIAVTGDIYSHVVTGMKGAATRHIDAVLWPQATGNEG